MKRFILCLSFCLLSTAVAKEPEACRTVRIVNPGWSNVSSTSHVVGNILKRLGYLVEMQCFPPGLIYASLSSGTSDVFLANWIPVEKIPNNEDYFKVHSKEKLVDLLAVNQSDTKRTLAANEFASALGIEDFADIAKHRKALNNTIYGNTSGIEHNNILYSLIDNNEFGLGGFNVIEVNNEDGLLQQLRLHQREQRPMVLLGWSPNPMVKHFNLQFLSGGDAHFGIDFGRSDSYTTTRKGYAEACPNVGQLLKNVHFTADMENQLANAVLFDGQSGEQAATRWMQANTEVWQPWLEGLTTFEGEKP